MLGGFLRKREVWRKKVRCRVGLGSRPESWRSGPPLSGVKLVRKSKRLLGLLKLCFEKPPYLCIERSYNQCYQPSLIAPPLTKIFFFFFFTVRPKSMGKGHGHLDIAKRKIPQGTGKGLCSRFEEEVFFFFSFSFLSNDKRGLMDVKKTALK